MPKRLLFAVRCAATGALAYLLATAIGLPYPVWASMSSLIVSQESFDATRHSIVGRVIGTITGAVVAILVSTVAHHIGIGTALQIAVAVGVCALLASGHPSIRVCLWTCPVVLLTAAPGSSVEHAGLMRGSEVILGALAGGLIHWLMLWVTISSDENVKEIKDSRVVLRILVPLPDTKNRAWPESNVVVQDHRQPENLIKN